MRQAQIVGYVGSQTLLDTDPLLPSGLHYARTVVFGDWRDGDKRVPTGRGKNASGVDAGSIAINRAIVCWGKQSRVLSMIEKSSRKCIIALVSGRNEKVKNHLQKLAADGYECHLLKVDEKTAARVIVCDDARCKVQVTDGDKWITDDNFVVSGDAQETAHTPPQQPVEPVSTPSPPQADEAPVEAHKPHNEAATPAQDAAE